MVNILLYDRDISMFVHRLDFGFIYTACKEVWALVTTFPFILLDY